MVLVLFSAFLLFLSNAASADSGIAAKINDDIVTRYDLSNRIAMILVTSGRDRDSAEDARILRPKVLDMMIDETLKRQEIKRQDISVPDEEIRAAAAAIEKRNGQAAGSLRAFLQSRGVPYAVFAESVRTDIGWALAVRKLFGDAVRPTPDDLSAYMEKNPKAGMDEAFRRLMSERLEQRAYLHLKDLKRRAVIEHGK